MKRLLFVVFLAGSSDIATYAADPETCPIGEPNPALVDAIVRKLEADGALDQAVERALLRVIKRQEDARQAEEAKNLAKLQQGGKAARPVTAGRDHVRGNPSAEVSLIEYTDFECPFCKRFHSTAKGLLERFGGRVNWVLRHYPLPFHEPAARDEAVAAECAARLGGNDAFWKYSDGLFQRTRSNGRGLPEDNALSKLAASLGLNADAFGRCLRDDKIAKRIDEDVADGSAIGIQGTPTSVIRNNRTGATEVKVGALLQEEIAGAIQPMLDAGK
ncbi:MAG TPA: thioredoxin domain-containing protein [Burkholderiales bacterium]|nr:thioredoxin domain-containing protein [Burkholderiales bacterium]